MASVYGPNYRILITSGVLCQCTMCIQSCLLYAIEGNNVRQVYDKQRETDRLM